jgi:hypothetical protein
MKGMRRERHDGEPTEVAPQEPAGSLAAAPWLRNLGTSEWLVLLASLTNGLKRVEQNPGCQRAGRHVVGPCCEIEGRERRSGALAVSYPTAAVPARCGSHASESSCSARA